MSRAKTGQDLNNQVYKGQKILIRISFLLHSDNPHLYIASMDRLTLTVAYPFIILCRVFALGFVVLGSSRDAVPTLLPNAHVALLL